MIRIRASAAIVRDDHILLVEYNDPRVNPSVHYNLPGGGVEPGEPLHDAVRREVEEETTALVDVGPVLITWEVLTDRLEAIRDAPLPVTQTHHHLGFVFLTTLRPDSPEPTLPPAPDAYQTAVPWVPLSDLPSLALLPYVADRLLLALADPPHPHFFADSTHPPGYGE